MPPADPRPRLDPAEDARLVELCLAGDARAWEALVRRHERLVYGVARSYSLPDEDMGDVFQEVFAALFRGLPRMRDARALVRWLASTTDRIALATALRRRRERAMSTEPQDLEAVPSTEPWVGTELEQLEEQALVRLALEGVPIRCRELLRALYYEDPQPSYAELAKRLGVPIGSLGPTRARCFERLRQSLLALAGGKSLSQAHGAAGAPAGTGPDSGGGRISRVGPPTSDPKGGARVPGPRDAPAPGDGETEEVP